MHRSFIAAASAAGLLLFAGPARAESGLFVVTTDYSTGSTAFLAAGASEAEVNLLGIHSDAVGHYHDGRVYVVNRLGQDNILVLDEGDLRTPAGPVLGRQRGQSPRHRDRRPGQGVRDPLRQGFPADRRPPRRRPTWRDRPERFRRCRRPARGVADRPRRGAALPQLPAPRPRRRLGTGGPQLPDRRRYRGRHPGRRRPGRRGGARHCAERRQSQQHGRDRGADRRGGSGQLRGPVRGSGDRRHRRQPQPRAGRQ